MRSLLACVVLGLSLSPACGPMATSPSPLPDWLTALIVGFQRAPVGNPPRSVYRYAYDGRIVYYVPAQCCDQFSTLYGADGQVLCAPDGGIAGHGDGRCPDFFQQRTNEQLIWRDPRSD